MSAIGITQNGREHRAWQGGFRSPPAARFLPYLALLALASSCASPPKVEPLATPTLDLAIRQFAGPSLRGPVSLTLDDTLAEIDRAPEHALSVRCRFVYLDRVKPEDLSSVLRNAKLFISDKGNQSLSTRMGQDPRVCAAAGDAAGVFVRDVEDGRFDRRVDAGMLIEALPEGVTLAVSTRTKADAEAMSSARASAPPDAVPRPIAVALSRGTGSSASTITALLALEELPVDAPPQGEMPLPTPIEPSLAASITESTRRRGVLLGEAPIVDGAPLVIVMFPPDERAHEAPLALIVEVSHPQASSETAAVHAEAVERCLRNVALESDDAGKRGSVLTPEEVSIRAMTCALQAVEIAQHHRTALAYLANHSGAALAESMAYVARDYVLAQFLASVLRTSVRADVLTPGPALGFKLESGAFRFLSQLTVMEEITPELSALMIRYAGEAGRYPEELEDSLVSCRNLADLDKRIIADNVRSLEDDRPASRVRAFDWLTRRGLAPSGYDPLASAHERHEALLRAEMEAEAAASSPSPGPTPASAPTSGEKPR